MVRDAVVTCPHGITIGSIPVGDTEAESPPVWKFTDLGNGRCVIKPSLLLAGHHGEHPEHGADCHFGSREHA
ncbi:MAG: hypothetical protein ACREB9_02715 [Thermoplasmata archaeon]